eukprot:jgi/Tetstr1/427234/TSEL_017421.t1
MAPTNCESGAAKAIEARRLALLARLRAHGGIGTSVLAGSAAADALGALAATVPGLRPAMRVSGVLPGLLWLLRVGGPAPSGAATRALCMLADDLPGAIAMRQSGAVSVALHAMAGKMRSDWAHARRLESTNSSTK